MSRSIITIFLSLFLNIAQAQILKLDLVDTKTYSIPVHSATTLSIKFPHPIESIDGSGFTNDPAKYSGEYLISTCPEKNLLSIYPLTENPLPRNLNISSNNATYVLKPYIVENPHEAWNVISFEDPILKTEALKHPQVSKSRTPPKRQFKSSNTAKIIGMIDTTKLLTQVDEKTLGPLLETMPAVTISLRKNEFFDFGTHRIFLDIVSRNNDLDLLVFGVRVINDSKEPLPLDPESFTARSGEYVYTQIVSDFKGILAPGESSIGYFAVLGSATGGHNYLSPSNKFRISLNLLN